MAALWKDETSFAYARGVATQALEANSCLPSGQPARAWRGVADWTRNVDRDKRIQSTVCRVSVVGDLVAYGHGVPPHWCTSAAAAEMWALFKVLGMSPVAPKMRTDSRSLLSNAEGGVASATAAYRPLARV